MAARNIAKSLGEKLTKTEKKTLRKQARKAHVLYKHSNDVANVSKEPTTHLMVGNGGLMCGVDRSQLLSVFSRFGALERVVMLPQRAYSFVTYKNVEDAVVAMRSVNGKPQDTPVPGTVFYLSYLAEGPDDVTISNHVHPPGLRIYEEFVSEEEEKKLLDVLGWDNVEEDTVQQQLRHRRVKHFGYEFLYGSNNVDKSQPLPGGIPSVCHEMLGRMVSQQAVRCAPDQLTINEYQPGQGIPPHVDTHSAFEDSICSLSLGAKITMDFRHPDGHHVPVLLPRRSLLVMSDESRYQWSHGITPRKFDIISSAQETLTPIRKTGEPNGCNAADGVTMSGVTQYERERRVSLTFRKILHVPCTCAYGTQCDSQGYKEPEQGKLSLPNTEDEAESLERLHVHEVYENIADHFSDTRHSPWPRIAKFLHELPDGSLVADVGCGNGKYLGINENIYKTGSDRSSNLVAIAKDRGHSVIVCDILALPYRSNSFDVCLCIAVLHHLSTTERRLAGLRELVRVIRPGGLALVYVWALEQQLQKVKKIALREIGVTSAQSQKKDDDRQVTGGTEKESKTVTMETEGVEESSKTREEGLNRTMLPENSAAKTYAKEREVKVNATRGEFEQQDLFVPWKFRGGPPKKEDNTPKRDATDHVFHRFYHVFKERELLDLCRRLGNVTVKESYYDKGNWCVIIEKTQSDGSD